MTKTEEKSVIQLFQISMTRPCDENRPHRRRQCVKSLLTAVSTDPRGGLSTPSERLGGVHVGATIPVAG